LTIDTSNIFISAELLTSYRSIHELHISDSGVASQVMSRGGSVTSAKV